jgi:hypothetical protein
MSSLRGDFEWYYGKYYNSYLLYLY